MHPRLTTQRIEAAERARGQPGQQQQQSVAEPVPRRLPTLEVIRSLQQQQQPPKATEKAPPATQPRPQQPQQQQPSPKQQPPPRSPGLLAGLLGRKS